MFKPVEKKSLSDAVFEQLRDQIVSGEMEPGERLPAERVLSEMLDVNRGAVREALKRLEQARLVSIRHGGATRVLDFRETAGTDLLAQLLFTADGDINTDVARSIMEMRSALGSDIARRCAERGRDVADALGEVVDEMEDHQQDLGELHDLNMQFWSLLVEAAGNLAYRLAFNSVREAYGRLRELLTPVVHDEITDTEGHRQLAEAIRGGDVDDAEFYARDLISRGEARTGQLADAIDRARQES